MVPSPSWEANWFAASQEIPRISRNPKVHYRTHKRPPPIPILGQPNPVHIPTSHLLEIHPNIIHPSTPRSPQWSLPSGFPTKTLYIPLSSPLHTTCPAHLILLYFITRTILGEEYRSLNSSLCSLLHSPVTSSLLGPNILLNTIFSNTKLDALISQIHFWNRTLHVSDCSSVHHQEFFTVHTAVVYVTQVCWQLASRIRTEVFRPEPARICRQTCMTLYHCCVCSEKLLMMDRGTVRNM